MDVTYWHWIAFGLLLILSEILTPGFYFLWIGLASVLAGTVSYIFPELGFVIIGTIFAISSVVFCYVGKISLYKKVSGESSSTLNNRGSQYIGQTVVVAEAIEHGVGKVKVGDTVWPAKSENDFKKGQNVKIIGVDGIQLIVK